MIKVGIIGGAGYTAGELIRLLLNHPEAEIVFVNSSSNAGNKITTIGDEIDVRIETVLELFERLLDFGHMLVLESFVDTHVVVAPAEVARGARFHTGAGTSGNGVHHDIIIQHQMFGKR